MAVLPSTTLPRRICSMPVAIFSRNSATFERMNSSCAQHPKALGNDVINGTVMAASQLFRDEFFLLRCQCDRHGSIITPSNQSAQLLNFGCTGLACRGKTTNLTV